MRRFTTEEVSGIMSQDHLHNTAAALGKSEEAVSAQELIAHWGTHHPNPQLSVIHFDVHAKDELEGAFFHPDVEIHRATS